MKPDTMDLIQAIVLNESSIGLPCDPLVGHIIRATENSNCTIKPHWKCAISEQGVSEESLNDTMKSENINVVGQHISAAFGALRGVYG